MNTGGLVQVLPASSYGFSQPQAVSSDGTHVWVANIDSNSVAQLSTSTGALVQVMAASTYGSLGEVLVSDPVCSFVSVSW
jgi:DNA-binding beta-propeller fold protein YncE